MLSSDYNLSSLVVPSRPVVDTVDLSSTSGEHERGVAHRLPGITLISEWPHGSFVENLAAKHDGHILVTVYSSNEIYEIDPNSTKSNQKLLATLPAGPTGIVEVDFNHFYVTAGTIGQRNTWSIYCVSLHHGSISFKQVLDVDSALYLNGLCVLSYEQGILLSVDSMLGQIFKINLHTKQSEIWYENDLLKRRSHDVHVPGINGIRRCSIDGCIYLTNTDRAIILRLAIDPFDYRPKGQLETIVRNIVCDDFTIDRLGTIYATTHAHNSLIRLTPIKDGEYLREEIGTVADGLAGATSCIFGRTYHDRTRCGSINNAISWRGGMSVKFDYIISMLDQPKSQVIFFIFTCIYLSNDDNVDSMINEYFIITKFIKKANQMITVMSIYPPIDLDLNRKSLGSYLSTGLLARH